MTDESHPTEESTPNDAAPSPSKWRKRLGLASLASLGGAIAWLFGRRKKPEA